MEIKTKRGPRRMRNQRVINRRFIVTDHVDSCEIFEAGKLYKVSGFEDHGFIRAQHETLGLFLCAPIGNKCPHLDYVGAWSHPTK